MMSPREDSNRLSGETSGIDEREAVMIDGVETDSDKEEAERLWFRPDGEDTGIVVRNGLTRTKVPLIVRKKSVSWYMCGPTVYDDAHIGDKKSCHLIQT